jgi:hypothetical protein
MSSTTFRQKYIVNNNGFFTFLCEKGDCTRIQNNKMTNIDQYRGDSSINKDSYCVRIEHEGGSFKSCSDVKTVMEEFVKALPQNDNIKRKYQW